MVFILTVDSLEDWGNPTDERNFRRVSPGKPRIKIVWTTSTSNDVWNPYHSGDPKTVEKNKIEYA